MVEILDCIWCAPGNVADVLWEFWVLLQHGDGCFATQAGILLAPGEWNAETCVGVTVEGIEQHATP